MPGAKIISLEVGEKFLVGMISGHRTGNDIRAGIFPVHGHVKIALRRLVPMGHQPFLDHQPGIGSQMGDGFPLGGIDSFDLHRLHLHVAAFLHGDLRPGIHDPLAVSIAFSVMLFHIF